ncbi:ABC transporter permease [Massilia sp. SM-13]|uniref:ABC transporter permease n=1 Tax=Pseudoduganella rhizocola TaxID=3382643 RepID=UPI0038B6A02D
MMASRPAQVWRIAREEWRAMARSRVALVAGLLLLVLTFTASLVSYEHVNAVSRERAALQHEADEQWNSQPDRHPHRVVHYGHYIFRSLSPLAFFDLGVTPFTGHALFLEGHRQNSANFSDAGQSSVLLRFGQLTPAFVLQTVAPLLLVFLAFGSIARERERGQLRLVMAQGVSGGTLLAGKLLGHAAAAAALASPALAALCIVAAAYPDARWQALWMLAGYLAYLLVWSGAAVLVSASLARARDALVALIALWMFAAVVLPRAVPEFAGRTLPRETRIESEAAIAAELKNLGDSHNPDDPHFRKFRERTLAAYGVSRVEDLPVNYGGLVIAEGERLTSELFQRHMRADYAIQARQAELLRGAALASPLIALQELSAAMAGTDRASHERFLLDGEAYRYRFVQALNRLHAEKVRYQDDRDQRIDASNWRALPRFSAPAQPLDQSVATHALPAFGIFALWLAVLGAAAAWTAHRLERKVQ